MCIYVSRTFQKSERNSGKVPRKFRETPRKVEVLLGYGGIRIENPLKKCSDIFFLKSFYTDLLLDHVGTRYERIRDSLWAFPIGIRSIFVQKTWWKHRFHGSLVGNFANGSRPFRTIWAAPSYCSSRVGAFSMSGHPLTPSGRKVIEGNGWADYELKVFRP